MLAAGIEYDEGPRQCDGAGDHFRHQLCESDRVGGPSSGSRTPLLYHNFSLSYTRQFDPSFSVTGAGRTGRGHQWVRFGLPKTLVPTYSFSATWTITPKLALTASASRAVTPPTTVIGNAETSYNTTLSLTYAATPKVAVTASASAGYSSAEFTPGLVGTMFATFLTATDYYSASAGVTLCDDPVPQRLADRRVYGAGREPFITPQDVITVSLNYKPY